VDLQIQLIQEETLVNRLQEAQVGHLEAQVVEAQVEEECSQMSCLHVIHWISRILLF
jgi:hypothetical protein